jgi:hypothetical protein
MSGMEQHMNESAHEQIRSTSLPVQARLGASLLDAIDSWRRRQADIPTRPEAIRRLCAQALGTATRPQRHVWRPGKKS